MGRKKKEIVVKSVNGEDAEVGGVKVKPVEVKKEPYSLHAWFSYIDNDGFKIKAEFKSEGNSVKELLENLEFPKGVNRLVNVKLTHGANEFEKALSPHKARAILEHKDIVEFNNIFRGI